MVCPTSAGLAMFSTGGVWSGPLRGTSHEEAPHGRTGLPVLNGGLVTGEGLPSHTTHLAIQATVSGSAGALSAPSFTLTVTRTARLSPRAGLRSPQERL